MEDYKPKLQPVRELVLKIQEMGLSVTELDFYQPNSRRIIHIFECFIYLFSPERHELVEELRANAFEKLNTIIGSNADNCSLDAAIIFKVFSEFLKSIRFTDIQLTDLTNPTSRRIIPIMNAVVNFALFCQPRYEEYLKLAEKIEPVSNALQEAKNKEIEKLEELNHKKALKLKNEQERQEIISVNDELFNHMADMKKELEELQKTVDNNKKDREAMKDQLQGSQYYYVEKRSTLDHYRKAQETDTEKMQRENDALRSRIEETNNKLNLLSEETQLLQSEINLKENAVNNIKKCIDALSNIKKNTTDMNRQIKVYASIQEEIENSLNTNQEKSKLKSQLNDEITQLEVEAEQLEEQTSKFIEMASLYYKTVEEKDQELQNSIASNSAEELEYKEQIEVYEKRYNEILYRYNYQIHQYNNKFVLAHSKIENLYEQFQNKVNINPFLEP